VNYCPRISVQNRLRRTLELGDGIAAEYYTEDITDLDYERTCMVNAMAKEDWRLAFHSHI